MRSALPLLAASAALALAASAYAGGKPAAAASSDAGAASSDSSSAGASSATGAGANTSATAGGFHVGETVVDNTGANIGTITSLDSANGQQMAVIKMGDQSFQAPADRLGTSNGQATINMTKAQLSAMIKDASAHGAGAPSPSAGAPQSSSGTGAGGSPQ